MAQRERKSVLVLPDVGLEEKAYDKLRDEFQNSLVRTLKGAGADMAAVIIVVVIVVILS